MPVYYYRVSCPATAELRIVALDDDEAEDQLADAIANLHPEEFVIHRNDIDNEDADLVDVADD